MLGIWKPCIEATGLRDLNLPKERFHEAVRKARTPKINDFHHPASSFSNSSAVQMTIILEREDHEHAAGVVSEESFLLNDFLIDSLETSCISTSYTDHYSPLILVNTIFSCFLFFILFLPTGSIFYFPVHKLKSIYSSSSSSFFNLFF